MKTNAIDTVNQPRSNAQVAPGWMRPPEAAAYMSISRRCLSDWMRQRLVPYAKAGRKCVLFRRADLDAALQKLVVRSI